MKPAIRLTLLAVLLVSLAGAVQADYHDTVFCGDLAAADCALLESSSENAAQQTSGSGVLDLDMTMRDLDEHSAGQYSIALDADVVWSGDLSGFQDMGMESLAIMSEPEDMLALFDELFSQLSGSLTISLQAPQGLPEMEGDSMLEALASGVGMEARLVDGVLYVDLASLATIMAAEDGVPSGWFGFNMMEMLKASMAMESMTEGMKDPHHNGAGKGSDDDGQMAGAMDEEAIAEMEAMAAAWSDPDFLGGFMTVERLEDQTVADQVAAVFRTTVDLEALFEGPELYELLQTAASMGGEPGIDEDDMLGVSMMMGMFAGGMQIEALTYVSIAEELPLREELRFAWPMAEMMSLAGEDATGDPYIGVDYRMDYGYPAETPEISVPENAFIISPGLLTAGAMDADA